VPNGDNSAAGPVTLKQLKLLATEEEASQQKLVEEALNLLFIKRGWPTIA
jgi:hypothetical protein